ncbi:MAG: DUF1207 domain-containing protein, partial [Halobacteria archaeon]|nr:DUF1207 domain-containing protein [Halobacteria archaeon]
MYRKLLIGILYLVTHTVVYAQTSSTSSEPTYKEDIKTVELFPVEKIYPQYIADPLRPTFSAQYQYYFDTTIIDTSDNRFDLKIGGPLPIFQLVDKSTRKPYLQFVVEAGFHGQFDAEKSEDNIGWDGIYSFYLVFQNNTNLATRIGTHHVSSHIGDELIARTGRSRINYTRQEIRAGIGWTFLPKSQ